VQEEVSALKWPLEDGAKKLAPTLRVGPFGYPTNKMQLCGSRPNRNIQVFNQGGGTLELGIGSRFLRFSDVFLRFPRFPNEFDVDGFENNPTL